MRNANHTMTVFSVALATREVHFGTQSDADTFAALKGAKVVAHVESVADAIDKFHVFPRIGNGY